MEDFPQAARGKNHAKRASTHWKGETSMSSLLAKLEECKFLILECLKKGCVGKYRVHVARFRKTHMQLDEHERKLLKAIGQEHLLS